MFTHGFDASLVLELVGDSSDCCSIKKGLSFFHWNSEFNFTSTQSFELHSDDYIFKKHRFHCAMSSEPVLLPAYLRPTTREEEKLVRCAQAHSPEVLTMAKKMCLYSAIFGDASTLADHCLIHVYWKK